MKKFAFNEFKNIIYILVGTIFLSIGVVSFLVPNGIITGGTAGLALLLHHLTPFTIGTLVAIINIPLLILGIKYFGKMYAIRSIITILLISFTIDLFNEYLEISAITHDIVLGTIFGGVFIGLGLGLVINAKSSAGGTTIIAAIISSKTHYKAAEVMLFFDVLILLFSIYVLGDIEKVLWSVISIYITAKIVDIILTGRPSKKVVNLVTNEIELISNEIVNKLGPDGTIITGKDLDGNKDKTMILILVDIGKVQELRDIAMKYDKDAFLVISDASELHGRGY